MKRLPDFEVFSRFVLLLGFLILLDIPLCRAGEILSGRIHLSLVECIDIALEKNTQIIQSRSGIEIADVQVENARNAFLPTFNTSYGFSRQV